MSTTLHTPPRQRAAPSDARQATSTPLVTRRPTNLERLALRVGLLLITYGRRRYALGRDEQVRISERARARHAREHEWDRTRWLLLPPR